MKRIPLLLLTLAAALFAASSCVENLGVGGGGINFGASAGGVLTKTAYAGFTGTSGTGYDVGVESINWVDGDQITILCEQAKDNKSGTYSITPNSTKPTEASAVTGGGLQWKDEGTMHYFHAAYPASNVTLSSVSTPENGSQFVAEIPVEQDGASMAYAYMYAAAKSKKTSSEVGLRFEPLVTAFRFEIKSAPDDSLPAGTTLTKLKLSSESSTLAGDFRATISSDGTLTEVVDPTPASAWADSVVVKCAGDGDTLRTGSSRAYTFFALPVTQTKLTLTLTFKEGGKTYTRSLKLATTSGDISVAACEKLRVTGLAVTPTKIRSVATQSYNPGSGFGDADFTYTVVPVSRTIRTGESFTLSASSTATPPLRPDDFTYDVNVTTGVNPITLDPLSATSNAKSWTVTGNTPGQVVVTVKATRGSIVKEKTCTVTVVAESSTEGYGVGTGSGF